MLEGIALVLLPRGELNIGEIPSCTVGSLVNTPDGRAKAEVVSLEVGETGSGRGLEMGGTKTGEGLLKTGTAFTGDNL